MSKAAISIKNLTKAYGPLTAVDHIDLEVPEGAFVAFLGPNGAGKTTTIHCATGLCNFQGGSISVFGMDVVKDYRKTRRLIGLCPQEFNFDPFFNIENLLVYQAGYFGVSKANALSKARELLDYFRLSDKKNQDFRKLSGGMKRRLLLCRALVHDPNILILDEPTAGTDIELKYMVWNFLTDLNKKGKTIFLTTHYMEEAERLAKTIAIIDRGKIVHCGDKDLLIQNQSLEKKYLELTRNNDD
jgi:ABC-2 type transport system ATP-binding protein